MNSPPSYSRVNTAVQQVRLKDQVRIFCEKLGFWISVNQSCTAFLRKNPNSSYEPFLVTLTVFFGEIEDGE